jgi:hypothetical protein
LSSRDVCWIVRQLEDVTSFRRKLPIVLPAFTISLEDPEQLRHDDDKKKFKGPIPSISISPSIIIFHFPFFVNLKIYSTIAESHFQN